MTVSVSDIPSPKSRGVAFALAALLGPSDSDGRLVSRWDPEGASRGDGLSAEVLEELSTLRSELAEVAERLDFAERLLAQPRPAGDQPRSTVRS